MRNLTLLMVLLSVIILAPVNAATMYIIPDSMEGKDIVTVDILFDNYTEDGQGSTGLWGFACLIRGFEKNVLFDTGTQGDVLMKSLEKTGTDPKDIDIVVLSHEHGDHIGGLEAFLTANPEAAVYFPPSFSDKFKNRLGDAGIKMVEVEPGQEICRGLFTTGEMIEPLPEDGIYFQAKDGLVVITGCAHPGIVEITTKAKDLSGVSPYFVLGGFHLRQHSDQAVRKIVTDLKSMGVTMVFPTHCTGDKARAIFREEFGENCVLGGMGSCLTFEL